MKTSTSTSTSIPAPPEVRAMQARPLTLAQAQSRIEALTRALEQLQAGAGSSDTSSTPLELMTTREAAAYLQCSTQYLEIARFREKGPPYVRMGSRMIRYLKSELDKWMTPHDPALKGKKGKEKV